MPLPLPLYLRAGSQLVRATETADGGMLVEGFDWQSGEMRPGGAVLRGFSLSEIDIEAYAARPWVATATDGWISLPEDGLTHVRVYGTVPRKIAHYARDRGVLSVSDAIRSSTSLPATILGLEDRGFIRAGLRADLVVMDLQALSDNATFFDPHRHASGIEYVLVGGVPVVDGGELTGALPGEVVPGPGVAIRRETGSRQPASGTSR